MRTPRLSSTRSRLTPVALVLSLALTGCGGGDEEQPDASDASPEATCAPNEPEAPAPEGSTEDLSVKPEVVVPDGPPPCRLLVSDIVVGDGPAAQAGQQIAVQYVGVSYDDGEQFDASWDNGGQPFVFPLGAGQVIPGWDQGLVGMQVGGRRQLTIPPDLAYGADGVPGAIDPGATLVFVVDLEEVGVGG